MIDILGIDRDQFTKIAMIAQGDFRKLLNADTKERAEIFRRIFRTEGYRDLQKMLQVKHSELNREYEQRSLGVKQYISGLKCAEDDPLRAEAEKAAADEMLTDDAVRLLERLVERDGAALKKADDAIRETDEAIVETEKLLTKADERKAKEEKLEKYVKEAEEKSAALEGLKKTRDEQAARRPEIEKLTETISKIRSELDGYAELDEKATAFEKAAKEISADTETLKAKQKTAEDLAAAIEKAKARMTELENAGGEKTSLENKKEKKKTELDALSEIEKSIGELGTLEEKLAAAQEEYRIKAETAKQRKEGFDAGYRAYLDEQAGIIAETLADGEPCPVCGSTEHPAPAKKDSKAPSADELDGMRELSEKAEGEAKKASETAGALKTETEMKRSALKETMEKAGVTKETIGKKKDELESGLAETIASIAAADEKIKEREDLRLSVPEDEKAMETAKAEASDLDKRIAAAVIKKEETGKRAKELRAKLSYGSKTEAEEAIIKLEDEKKTISDAITSSEEAFRTAEKRTGELEALIGDTKKELEENEEADRDALAETKRSLEEKKKTLSASSREIQTRISTNEGILENVSREEKEIKTIEDEMKMVKALSDTANGKLTGKDKVMLETYVQMAYFDRVIARANTRLMVMSDGQYELKRRTESGNKGSQSGLDLDVVDHYNGSERSVSSLSGGESFKASLSLALGLSDEMQSQTGGIRLDTMFVDEGFGSLSEESLAQAMRALADLGGSDKLVGIISHVGELKEKIDKQIVVTKRREGGSTVEIAGV